MYDVKLVRDLIIQTSINHGIHNYRYMVFIISTILAQVMMVIKMMLTIIKADDDDDDDYGEFVMTF